LVLTIGGNVGATLARQVATALGSKLVAARERVHMFCDLEQLEAYHSDLRVLCTQALLSNWSRVAHVDVFAKSRIVKMGVAVANVALKDTIRSFATRADFERELKKALRG
jgi:hypothetical protein